MVVELAADEGEVQAGHAHPLGHREVGVVGHLLIEEDGQGAADRALGGFPVAGDQVAVVGAGLEHVGPAAPAARLHVDDQAGAPGEGMLLEEGLGAAEAPFLAVGDEDDDVAGRLDFRRLEIADHFQGHGHGGGVIGGARRAGGAVVVAHQNQRRQAPVLAGQDADQVLHPGAGEPLRIVGREGEGVGLLNDGREAQLRHSAEQIVADLGVGRRADGVRFAGDDGDVAQGAVGRELGGRRGGRRGLGRDRPLPGQQRGAKQRQRQPDGPHPLPGHGVSPCDAGGHAEDHGASHRMA